MAKEKKCPDCPPVGAPAYMLTYGDMMTLLVTFFVLLISFSSTQEAKFNDAMGSLQGALGVLKASGSSLIKLSAPSHQYKEKAEEELKKILEELKEASEKQGTQGMMEIIQTKDKIHFNISNPMLFESGSADLKDSSAPLLAQIASVLSLVPFEVRIEGHTDNVPINTPQFPSNWELSHARALAIVKRFINGGVDPARFQAIGYAEYRPIATNDTPEGRSLNRRVEISVNLKYEITNELFEENELNNQE